MTANRYIVLSVLYQPLCSYFFMTAERGRQQQGRSGRRMDEIEYDREINGRGQKQRKQGGGKSYGFGTWFTGSPDENHLLFVV